MKNILLLILVFSLYGCNISPTSDNGTDNNINVILDEFELQLQKDLRDDNLNGSLSMAIIKGDKVIRSKAFGNSNLQDIVADTSNIYRIGSISKSFTAFLMMQLVQDSIIRLDDFIEEYLPEVKEIKGYSDSTKFTFRQLASHTSGLAHLPKLPFRKGHVDDWESMLMKCLPATNFISIPNERYSYSNIGFGILGLAISNAANKPFVELMETRIFKPLNMHNSFYLIPEDRMDKLANGRSGGPMGGYDDQKPRERLSGRGWAVPNGGIFSTANDLAKFMRCNMGYSEILNNANLTLMQTSQTPDGKWHENYGIGFTIYQDSIISTIGHQGGTAGYRANFLFEKESEYGVVLLRNYNWGTTDLNLRSTVLLRKLKEAEKSK